MSQQNTPNPNSQGIVQIIVILVATGGVPTISRLFNVTDNPLTLLGLALLGAILGFGLSFVSKLWTRVEPVIIDNAAKQVVEKLAERTENLVEKTEDEKHRQHYLQHLIYRHRVLDVKGLTTLGEYSLDLEQVFVDLSISPDHQPSGYVVREAGIRVGQRYPIWYYLNASQLSHLAILGAPGSGKTTLVKYITLALAKRTDISSQEVPDKLPILLFLRDYAQKIVEQPTFRLSEAVHASLARMDEQEKPPEAWIADHLRNGDCLVMLDGLDEVADEDIRRKVVEWVEGNMTTYGKNLFVVTSRPYGYRNNPIAGVTMLDVRPFDRKQVEQFVENWYLATEIKSQQRHDQGVRIDAKQGAEELVKRIYDTPDISELATNPLLLTMITNVHRYSGELPGSRVALYAEMCRVFLGKRDMAKGGESANPLLRDLNPERQQGVLQVLAYELMCRNTREVSLKKALSIITEPLRLLPITIDGETFLNHVRDRSGILIEHESQRFAFSHKTFQEFLAAVHVEENKTGESLQDLTQQISDKKTLDWWRETIRLYCARTDATPIIRACIGVNSVQSLALAFDCLKEARAIDPDVRDQLERVLTENLEWSDRQNG